MPRYRLVSSQGYVGCDHSDEIDTEDSFTDEEWEEMDPSTKDSYLLDLARSSAMEQLDYWYEECSEDEGNCYG